MKQYTIEIWQECCTLRNIPDGTHFNFAMATCSVPVPSSLKSNITICSCMGQKYTVKNIKEETQWRWDWDSS